MEQESSEARRHNASVPFLWVFFVLFVVYPLSVGPVFKMCGASAPPQFVQTFYAPLQVLNDNCRPVEQFYDWYGELWGLQ